jgi:glycosyltransferase involved in cell wall biosynthesis
VSAGGSGHEVREPERTEMAGAGGSGHEVREPERTEMAGAGDAVEASSENRGPYEPKEYKKLSVIVPVYNERNTVVEILRRMRAVDLPVDREFIVVDDGSDDGTRAVLTQLGDSTTKIVKHPTNRGKGAAIRTGLEHVTGDLVLIQDADLEYDPEDWLHLLAPVLKGRARVVYGSRFTGEHRNMLFLHWCGNKMLSLVTNLLYNTTLSDMETCYKLFDRDVIRDVIVKSDRFDFEPEITAKVLRQGVRIYEVPISYAGREFDEGKKITWRDGFAALYALVKFRFVD